MTGRLQVDIGVRLDLATRVGALIAPRVGLTWKPRADTTVSGGAGLFGDKAPLDALAFASFQAREVTAFDALGTQQGPTLVYRNVASDRFDRPRARWWSVGLDRRLGRAWQLRAAVQERRGSHELVVTPTEVGDQGPAAILASVGESRTRSVETTIGFRPPSGRHQFYVSYVRASTLGNVNHFDQVEATFRDPLLGTAETAPLPADVPHRVLVWGLFSLPFDTTVAPFLDVRSGFPFSAVNDDWSYAGPRNADRRPLFASFDLVVNKVVRLPGGVRARVGFKVYNLIARGGGRDVQRDIERADFGRTYDAPGRQIRGVFEFMWNGDRR